MPAKVYLDSPPHGDFRAMPARGGGMALLKWVTSFPGNPARGLPTVTGALVTVRMQPITPVRVPEPATFLLVGVGGLTAAIVIAGGRHRSNLCKSFHGLT